MDNRIKYLIALSAAAAFMVSAYYFPAEVFITFVLGWLFFIPAAFIVYLVYGLMKHMAERKHRIVVAVKPTEAMRALARREAEIEKEKERLYKEMQKGLERE